MGDRHCKLRNRTKSLAATTTVVVSKFSVGILTFHCRAGHSKFIYDLKRVFLDDILYPPSEDAMERTRTSRDGVWNERKPRPPKDEVDVQRMIGSERYIIF